MIFFLIPVIIFVISVFVLLIYKNYIFKRHKNFVSHIVEEVPQVVEEGGTTKGCLYLEKGIDFEDKKICACCINNGNGKGIPLLIDNYAGENINWEQFRQRREEMIARQKKQTIPECVGCYNLQEYKFSSSFKLSEFHFSCCRLCNARCVYCPDEYNSGSRNFDVLPQIESVIKNGYYEPGGTASFQGGEPTLMPNFEKIVHILQSNGTKIRVCSSSVKYSPAMAHALSCGNASVVISIDSGCAKTYRKIKCVDSFDIVCKNIKGYVDAAQRDDGVIVKYLIVPGYNDNLDEVDKFIGLVKKLGVKTIAVDAESNYQRANKTASPHVYMIYDYIIKKAREEKLVCLEYCFLLYILKYRNTKVSQFINNRFLYNLIIKINRLDCLNFNYKILRKNNKENIKEKSGEEINEQKRLQIS